LQRCDCRLNPKATAACCPWIDCTENAKDIQDKEFPDCLSRHKYYGASDEFIKDAKCATYADKFCYRRWGDKRDSKDAMMNCCTKTCNKHNKHIVGPRAVGEACSTNDGCTSGSCEGRKCQAVALGEACTAPTDCTTGRCEVETDSTKTCKGCTDKLVDDKECFEEHRANGADVFFAKRYTSCAVLKHTENCFKDTGFFTPKYASKEAVKDCCAETCGNCPARPDIVTDLGAECNREKLCQKPMTCKDGKCQQDCTDNEKKDSGCLKRHDSYSSSDTWNCKKVKKKNWCLNTENEYYQASKMAAQDCCAETCGYCSTLGLTRAKEA
jgi:hypothetical protein